jgi:hypothetical protein
MLMSGFLFLRLVVTAQTKAGRGQAGHVGPNAPSWRWQSSRTWPGTFGDDQDRCLRVQAKQVLED